MPRIVGVCLDVRKGRVEEAKKDRNNYTNISE